MKRFFTSSVAAGLALSLLGAPLAMAQPAPGGPPGQHEENGQHNMMQGPGQHMTPQHMAPPQHNAMQGPQHMQPPMHQPAPVQHASAPGPGGHGWARGGHFTGNRAYVSDWHSHHLSAPPSGYRWVQDGSQFVLIAVASGLIANVILSH